MSRDPAHYQELQAQIDAITGRMAVNRADIDELQARADKADARTADIEVRVQIDRDMIAELQREGVLSQEHAAQMEEALKSSRTIGAAIGMIVANRYVREDEAFSILVTASQNANRKLRDLAREMVASRGHAGLLP